MKKAKHTCKTCRFWYAPRYEDSFSEYATGQCRRFPPVIDTSRRQHISIWPNTPEDTFCGEHQAKGEVT